MKRELRKLVAVVICILCTMSIVFDELITHKKEDNKCTKMTTECSTGFISL